MKSIKFLLGFIVCSIMMFGCSNIYYIGQTTTPINVYNTTDTTVTTTYIIPVGSKVLTKRRTKKFHYIIYQNHKGYTFNPVYANYRKYDYSLDGELYGYTSKKYNQSNSSSGNKTKSTYSSTSKTVKVKGYTKKNGTYVSPHTRSSPSRKH